jgi:hypothetical protein
MEEKKIFSVAALFDSADDITRAAKETTTAGYTKYDINTPYPVHGMEKAMNLKPSLLGIISFVIGIGGVTFAVLFMSWASIIDYPLVIGGKPFFSWPAFVPVAFEVTVLSASVGTVIAMIALFFKFPHNSHALHETNYMKKVSADKFGINISVIDPLFDEIKIKDFFAKLGGKEIETIYEEPFPKDIKMFDKRFIGVLVMTALVTAGATYFTLNKLLYMQPFSWMSEQDKGLPQSKSEVFPDGFTMRTPVEGTVARGFIPYEYKGMKDSAVINLSNPLPYSKEIIAKGKTRFDTYCSPCHGYFGKGDSRLHEQFPKPPTLHSDKVRNWADGNIYHVITNGQNIMPSYEKQISRDDRWAIVHYIRVLQRSQNAKDSDFENSK